LRNDRLKVEIFQLGATIAPFKTLRCKCVAPNAPPGKMARLWAQSYQTRLLKAQPHQKRLVKNLPGKTAQCACGAGLRAQPTVDFVFKIF